MQIVEILSVDEQVEHVVTLPDYLEASFDPVELSHLEELGLSECLQKRPFVLGLGGLVVKLVKNPNFEEFLVRNSYLDRITLRTPLFKPRGH